MNRTVLLVAAIGSMGAVAVMNVLPLLPIAQAPQQGQAPAPTAMVPPPAPVAHAPHATRPPEAAAVPAPRPVQRAETRPAPDLDEAQLAKATLEALAAQRTNPTETAALPPPPAPAPAVAAAPVAPPAPAAPPPVTVAPPTTPQVITAPHASQPAALASTAPRVGVPDTDRIILLVRTALLSLNDAMRTGNYTVLRDIGGPTFREQNSAARLSELFSGLGSQGLDLTMVAVMAPQLTEAPTLDGRNTLRLKGYFPGKPLQINFEILYEPVGGHWRLFNLAVAAVPSTPPAATEAPARAPRTAASRPAPQ